MFISSLRVATVVTVFAAFTPLSQSQSIKYEAVQLVEMTMQSSWENLQPILGIALEKFETEMAKSGKIGPAEAIFIEEFKKSFNRDGFSKALAASISAHMTDAELKETLAFYRTPVGQKWLQFSASQDSGKTFTDAALQEACAGTKARTTFMERLGDLSRICR